MAQRGEDQTVRERRVLRQQRAVEVGADRLPVDRALAAVVAVVAEAVADPRERPRARPEVRAAGVILEADHLADALDLGVSEHVADTPRPAGAGGHRHRVEDSGARQLLALAGAVEVAEELEAAADGQHRRVPAPPIRATLVRAPPGRRRCGAAHGPAHRRSARGRPRRAADRRCRRPSPRSRLRAPGSEPSARSRCRGRRRHPSPPRRA